MYIFPYIRDNHFVCPDATHPTARYRLVSPCRPNVPNESPRHQSRNRLPPSPVPTLPAASRPIQSTVAMEHIRNPFFPSHHHVIPFHFPSFVSMFGLGWCDLRCCRERYVQWTSANLYKKPNETKITKTISRDSHENRVPRRGRDVREEQKICACKKVCV